MNKKFIAFLLIVSVTIISCKNSNNKTFTVISNPIDIYEENVVDLVGTENIIYLPENRSNPETRTTGVHYFRFPAKTKTDLAPVFYLPSGPGFGVTKYLFLEKSAGWRAVPFSAELMEYNKTRDVIVLNQRGNPSVPGAPSPWLRINYEYDNLESEQNAIKSRIRDLKTDGIDPKGYNFANIVDDIEDIRTHYNYDKVALLGISFGSQWALGYMQRYPKFVDRAFLVSVEPVSHEYDDPQSIWNVIKRVEKYALEDAEIAKDLPEIGLTEAVKVIVERLENAPQKVKLNMSKYKLNEIIEVTANDFRALPYYKWSIEAWPKYITELYNGDYRFLALWKWESENLPKSKTKDVFILPYINTSIGISEKREKELTSREALKWIKDPGEVQRMWKEAIGDDVDVIDNTFRDSLDYEIPTLIVHGDLDYNTPMDNAEYLKEKLKDNAHLIKVDRGYHQMKFELINDTTFAKQLYSFMNTDFNNTSFKEFQKTLPTSYSKLAKIEFKSIKGTSLFDLENVEKN